MRFFLGALVLAGQFLMGCTEDTTSPPVDPNAQIVLLSPSGGETVKVGQTLHIRWKVQGLGLEEITAVNIEVSPDSGRLWIGLLNRSIPPEDSSWGDFAWTVPTSMLKQGQTIPLAGRTQVLLRVQEYTTSDPYKIATLHRPITISDP